MPVLVQLGGAKLPGPTRGPSTTARCQVPARHAVPLMENVAPGPCGVPKGVGAPRTSSSGLASWMSVYWGPDTASGK